MRLAVTGFVCDGAGSVAGANALFLRGLLGLGCEIVFFSKSSFVDPRPAARNIPGFTFRETDNRLADKIRSRSQDIPVVGTLTQFADVSTYNRLITQKITAAHRRHPFDATVWLGDYACGRTPGLPAISFAQGAPGTDARSILRRFDEIVSVAGAACAWKWRLLAALRLSRAGLPRFHYSDHIIVGSSVSRRTLHDTFLIPADRTSSMPYAIDLDRFQAAASGHSDKLRCLWLGRIAPRKRLDVFLDGLAEAIRRGLPAKGTIIGNVGFVPGYEKLIKAFPYPENLTWKHSVPREDVARVIAEHDVVIQPSEEENFGSSVAEAQACGRPVIVGYSNGNADYLCARDIHLADDSALGLASALEEIARRKNAENDDDRLASRQLAERTFCADVVSKRFLEIIEQTVKNKGPGA